MAGLSLGLGITFFVGAHGFYGEQKVVGGYCWVKVLMAQKLVILRFEIVDAGVESTLVDGWRRTPSLAKMSFLLASRA
ncbi:MAG: hypothetical protein ACREBC_12250 [Pyrinomonadaceae bacterium]